MMTHYSKCPLDTIEALDDGWLKTGDYGYVKADKVYIIGRIKVSLLSSHPLSCDSSVAHKDLRNSSKYVVGKSHQRRLKACS
jgi:acyl-CoA synthetase (AMP-forming)/AMP-acid ligase II